ncbi:TAXI family TRAP transporter solute-binding subunit [Thermomonospora umbrina]|uniref:TRAP transporter TAXI family solute receptor n=1 Tax=Thermomonospora umbrina TaxID=111806 RepID=A0A3D9SID1_9ACTN|nr:TAXI family TRAP transporter solute-binding subunit [Thermomonospora umbrina]REE95662.1 hypothetical protein DFJ69_1071 [Thermomonospora umbrina]
MSRPPAPSLGRSLTLHMLGDWGTANLHRVCGWLGQGLADRSGPHTRTPIWNGRGYVDNVCAVGRGEVDLAMVTPAAFVVPALDGRGAYEGEAFPHLRAIGAVPHRDRMVVGVRRSLGISTFEELRAARPALRLATSFNDGVNHVGTAAHELLDRSGVDVVGWGGVFVEDERPFESFDRVRNGEADAIVHEAIMLPHWQDIGADLTFLPVERTVLDGLNADFGWPDATLPAGFFPDSPELPTLDFSDFLIVVRTDLPDDVAYALAWLLGETRDLLERQYRHLPPERSPLTYPLDPPTMGRTPIPLHPGAAGYYEALS